MNTSDWKDHLVEIFVPGDGDEGRIATGYPVAPGRILTAGHVLDGATSETEILVRWYNLEGPARDWRNIDEIVWRGGKDLDAALLDCAFPQGVYAGGSLSARRPRDDMRWASEGFLRAGKRGDQRLPIGLQGRVYSKGSRSLWFELGVDDHPDKAEDFKGASGGPVFVKGSIIGVIQSCPENFAGRKLHATPGWRLLEGAEFRREINRDTPQIEEVLKAIEKRIGASREITEALGDKLDIPEEGTPEEWVTRIARTIVHLSCYDAIGVLDDLHNVYCQEGSGDNAKICMDLVNRVLPATYDLRTVAEALDRIQQGEVMLMDLPIVNETCAEIIMAGVDDFRSSEFNPATGDLEFPPGKFKLPSAPETGMDPKGKGFQRAWEDFIIEKFVSPGDWDQFHSDQKLARQTVIERAASELAYRSKHLKLTSYYVFRNPMTQDRLDSWLVALDAVKESFPTLVFINVCEESDSPEEAGYTLRILRDMFKRDQAKPKGST